MAAGGGGGGWGGGVVRQSFTWQKVALWNVDCIRVHQSEILLWLSMAVIFGGKAVSFQQGKSEILREVFLRTHQCIGDGYVGFMVKVTWNDLHIMTVTLKNKKAIDRRPGTHYLNWTSLNTHVSGWGTQVWSHGTSPSHRQTDMIEDITFLWLRWRAVMDQLVSEAS